MKEPQPSSLVAFNAVKRLLPALHRAWNDETAHHSVVPRPEGSDPALGQCGVSNLWLARYLHVEHELNTVLVEGKLLVAKERAEGYVWTEIRGGDNPVVVDVANTQFGEPNRSQVYVGSRGDTGETVGSFANPAVYVPEEEFVDLWDVPRRKLMARCVILSERMVVERRARRIGSLTLPKVLWRRTPI